MILFLDRKWYDSMLAHLYNHVIICLMSVHICGQWPSSNLFGRIYSKSSSLHSNMT